MSARVDVPGDWLTAKQAGKLLGISNVSFPLVANAAKIRRKALPGMRHQYCREDVEKIAKEAIVEGALKHGSNPGTLSHGSAKTSPAREVRRVPQIVGSSPASTVQSLDSNPSRTRTVSGVENSR